MKTSISSKRDSKSTRDSSFSIESTIDVAVHASQDSMPAGMAKVLEMLGSAMDLVDPNGELTTCDNKAGSVDKSAGTVTFDLAPKSSPYTIKAGDSTVSVSVYEIQQAAAATNNTGSGGKG